MTSRTEEFTKGHTGEYPVIKSSDLSTDDARRSREVTPEEFQQVAARGRERYEAMKSNSAPTTGLDRRWKDVVDHAYEQTRSPWGGTTVSARTGKPMVGTPSRYALTAREPGTQSVSVAPEADRTEFASAMGGAKTQFAEILKRQGHHLGVFHDADTHRIDIDPVVVVPNRKAVEEIGAYTRATGGAYHFKSGEGYWPPHVKD